MRNKHKKRVMKNWCGSLLEKVGSHRHNHDPCVDTQDLRTFMQICYRLFAKYLCVRGLIADGKCIYLNATYTDSLAHHYVCAEFGKVIQLSYYKAGGENY